jgi:cobalt transporter subunit CbtA
MTDGIINRLLLTALLAGGIAGAVLAGLHQFTIIPMILEAETYETGSSESPSHGNHSHNQTEQDQANHSAMTADEESWEPHEGFERTFYTFFNTMVVGFGFALLLSACYAMRKSTKWYQGMVWGLGGFAAFNLAPALGLPPELPGAAAAGLESRQWWWLLTVGFTAAGLLLLAFASNPLKLLGIVLVVFPHLLLGAPQADSHVGLAPAELEQAFIVASLVSNAIFWLVLGIISAVIFSHLETRSSDRHMASQWSD